MRPSSRTTCDLFQALFAPCKRLLERRKTALSRARAQPRDIFLRFLPPYPLRFWAWRRGSRALLERPRGALDPAWRSRGTLAWHKDRGRSGAEGGQGGGAARSASAREPGPLRPPQGSTLAPALWDAGIPKGSPAASGPSSNPGAPRRRVKGRRREQHTPGAPRPSWRLLGASTAHVAPSGSVGGREGLETPVPGRGGAGRRGRKVTITYPANPTHDRGQAVSWSLLPWPTRRTERRRLDGGGG